MYTISIITFALVLLKVNASISSGDLSISPPFPLCLKSADHYHRRQEVHSDDDFIIVTDEKTTTSIVPQLTKQQHKSLLHSAVTLRGGSILAGWHPLGYGITDLGLQFLEFDGSLDSDVGRFLASFKSGRKRFSTLKDQWLEIVRVSKTGQSMRVYRKLEELLTFCVKAGFLS